MKEYKGKISIIMPAHNEEDHIYKSIKETCQVFKDLRCSYEIIVVDDGSEDKTYQEAQRAAQDFKNIYVKRDRKNYGKGRALKKGFKFAKGDMVVFLDADLDLHPEQIHTLFRIMKEKKADVVIGSKRHPESQLDYPFSRKIISSVYFFLVKILFGLPIRDTQTGLKLYKYQALKEIFPKVLIKRYAYDLELLVNAHHRGYKIAESPITLSSQRPYGRIKPIDIWHTWWDTMAIFYRMYLLRYYDKKK